MKKTNSNKKLIRSHQKGIALITTIILTSIMLMSIVLVSKEMIDEIRNSSRIDNSSIAYYAAEAGLEDALLEFRYDHNAEISEDNDKTGADVLCSAIPPTGCTPRTVDLTTTTTIPNNTVKSLSDSYYELTMWDKTNQILNQKILKDDVAEFEIPNMTQNVRLDWTVNPNTAIDSDYRVEITVYDENGNIIDAGKYFSKPTVDRSYTLKTAFVGSGKKIIRVKPSYVNVTPDSNGDYIEGTPITGDIPSINLSINNNTTSGNLISGATTNIESVGYYGGVVRKIVATVDRTSGNVLSIFDYSIYSGSNLIK